MKNKLLTCRYTIWGLQTIRIVGIITCAYFLISNIAETFNSKNASPNKILIIAMIAIAAVLYVSKYALNKWEKRNNFLINNFEDTAKYSNRKGKIGEYDEDGDLNIGLMLKRGSENALEDLNKLIGLNAVKKEVLKMQAVFQFESEQRKDKKNVARHMAFLGNPGTGKTEVASIFSGLLYQYGRIKHNMYLQCTGNDLTGEFAGQTKAKVDAIFKRCRGGVLFIDEAYILGQASVDNMAAEAVAQLLVHMEAEKDTVIIFAGYSEEMKNFIAINPGLASRISTVIEFPDYTAKELVKISKKFFDVKKVTLSNEAEILLENIFQEKINRHEYNFSNGRYARNCFNEIYQQHALLYQNEKDEKEADTIDIVDIVSIRDKLLA